jgi:hypothetical protein
VFDVVNECRPSRTSRVEAIEVVGASPSGQNRLAHVEPSWRCHLESGGSFVKVVFMSRVVKRSAARGIKAGGPHGRQDATSPLPRWIPPQLCQPVEKAPSGPQWLHEIKLDGFRMAARIDQLHRRQQVVARMSRPRIDHQLQLLAALFANVQQLAP